MCVYIYIYIYILCDCEGWSERSPPSSDHFIRPDFGQAASGWLSYRVAPMLLQSKTCMRLFACTHVCLYGMRMYICHKS